MNEPQNSKFATPLWTIINVAIYWSELPHVYRARSKTSKQKQVEHHRNEMGRTRLL